jgi:hypothetical protein
VYLPSQWMILRGRAVTLGHGKNLTLNWLSHTLCWFYWYKGCSHVGVFLFFKRHNIWRNHMESPYLRLMNSLE